MEEFLILFREPDGRKDDHTPEELTQHRQAWSAWMQQMSGHIACGSALTPAGRIIRPDRQAIHATHTAGTEIVGGFLLLQAHDFDDATQIMQSCPVFDFGGYAEIREIMQ